MKLDNNLFQTFIDKVKFKFIPVYNLKDNSIYGYKIIKQFDDAGYKDKEEVYEMAVDENIFKFFFLKLQEKMYETAIKLGYADSKFFHTFRVNYTQDALYYYSTIENLTSKFNLKKENIIFELKGADSWQILDKFLEVVDEDECTILIKETPECPLNLNVLHYVEANFVEISSLSTIKRLKEDRAIKSKIIFKVPENKNYTNEELVELGVDYAYKL